MNKRNSYPEEWHRQETSCITSGVQKDGTCNRKRRNWISKSVRSAYLNNLSSPCLNRSALELMHRKLCTHRELLSPMVNMLLCLSHILLDSFFGLSLPVGSLHMRLSSPRIISGANSNPSNQPRSCAGCRFHTGCSFFFVNISLQLERHSELSLRPTLAFLSVIPSKFICYVYIDIYICLMRWPFCVADVFLVGVIFLFSIKGNMCGAFTLPDILRQPSTYHLTGVLYLFTFNK